MFVIIGFVVVLVSVFGGFYEAGGPFMVLIQPAEFLIIGGAGLGALLASAPKNVLHQILSKTIGALKGETVSKTTYLSVLKLMYELLYMAQKEGLIALEKHIETPAESAGQLTYADHGLHLWEDLGAWWMRETGLPLPLGGNVVRRDLGEAVVTQVAQDVQASLEYALAHRWGAALAHAKQYSRGLSDERADTFVGMYVNRWTVDYGPVGRRAVQLLLDRAADAGLIPARVPVEFTG